MTERTCWVRTLAHEHGIFRNPCFPFQQFESLKRGKKISTWTQERRDWRANKALEPKKPSPPYITYSKINEMCIKFNTLHGAQVTWRTWIDLTTWSGCGRISLTTTTKSPWLISFLILRNLKKSIRVESWAIPDVRGRSPKKRKLARCVFHLNALTTLSSGLPSKLIRNGMTPHLRFILRRTDCLSIQSKPTVAFTAEVNVWCKALSLDNPNILAQLETSMNQEIHL